ncbi:MAG: UDP-N-acetylmuramate:L-alanyl-gamma-D-glutamyl-meso-diaminopimelate ligase [Gammaproteobacteria bacterium]|nr:UDP-N-acetylmuramate:L-alanyl-gamma-D-glutamyl-meso-diaminopimelate ligase [Gammaproteobacteria bacterium]
MKIHILGVCGTFMGGIALIARQQGHHVSGCDQNVYPPMSTQLEEHGISLYQGFSPEQFTEKPDLVIIGNAMSRGNEAVEYVLNQNWPYTSGPAWLAENVLQDRHVLAVSGTHGKTTTTSMLTWILDFAGLTPGFLIGGVPENFGVSARLGEPKYFVIEADEYDSAFFDKRSKFIHYHPRTLILNNLEFDHADIFPDLAAIQKQFQLLVRTVPSEGTIIMPKEDKNLQAVIKQGCWTPITYIGINGWHAKLHKPDGCEFTIYYHDKKLADVSWELVGDHNVHNALAAVAAAEKIGIKPAIAAQSLSSFKNVLRRLQLRGVENNVSVYDDFAHHPTAIETTIKALRNKVGKARIIAVLELASYTMRAGVHEKTLIPSLQTAEEIFIMKPKDYAWHLENKGDVPVHEYLTTDTLFSELVKTVQPGDQVLIMSNRGFDGIHERLLNIMLDPQDGI